MSPVQNQNPGPARKPKKRRRNFVERTLATFIRKTERALFAEEFARSNGFLQRLDPRVKILGLLALILDVTLARNLFTIIFLFAIAILLAVISRVPIRVLAARAWIGPLTFTGLIALPQIFITGGDPVFHLPLVGWTATAQGVTSAIYLISRVETTVTFSLLLVLCTLWTDVLKGLRVLHVPIVFVVILGMTYRYIFVMLETAQNMFQARQSRLVGALSGSEGRRVAAASVGVLLSKSFQLNNEVYLAMQSRGFRGEVQTLDDFVMQNRDWAAGGGFALIAAAAAWFGRFDSLGSLLGVMGIR